MTTGVCGVTTAGDGILRGTWDRLDLNMDEATAPLGVSEPELLGDAAAPA